MSKTRNAAFKSVEQPDLFMCHRSAGGIQKHISPDCNVDLIYNDTGVNGFIFSVSDLQPGCAKPESTIQGPSGTFV
jgi:hypothetical protein